MLNKKLIIILLPIIFLVSIQFINAQEKPGKVKTNKMMRTAWRYAGNNE